MKHTDPDQSLEMAALLAEASPERAFQFALAMHELACERADDALCELWSRALDLLRTGAPLQWREIA